MRTRAHIGAFACGVVLAITACGEIFGVSYASQLASISGDVTMPDTVAVNTDFSVTFATTGGGCSENGTTQVTMIDAHTAEVRPYDQQERRSKRVHDDT